MHIDLGLRLGSPLISIEKCLLQNLTTFLLFVVDPMILLALWVFLTSEMRRLGKKKKKPSVGAILTPHGDQVVGLSSERN